MIEAFSVVVAELEYLGLYNFLEGSIENIRGSILVRSAAYTTFLLDIK